MTVTGSTAPMGELHYGNGRVDRLYARVWGDSIHFGCYEYPDSDLESAVVETKRRMAGVGGLKPGLRVLEVASGWGATARYLTRAFAVHVTATNIEEDHLRTAAQLTTLSGLARLIEHAPADFHDLAFDDATFDIWWCQEATVHATHKDRVFAEAYRVLSPGGRIVFSDQTTDGLKCSATDRARLAHRHGSNDLYGAEDFMAAMRAAGFEDVTALDWSPHMARHFANLVGRIEANFDSLTADIPEETVIFNLSLWRFGRDLAAAGGIGWHCFSGRKAGG